MLKTILLTIIAISIALIGGAGSVWLALDSDFEFDSVVVGNWTAFPARGTPAADPYSKARFSREADLALGRAEGMVFIARRDSTGQPLLIECTYRIEGELPPARFWTLRAENPAGEVVAAEGRAPALNSEALLRQPNNQAAATISRHPAPGNWLALEGSGPFTLVLTLYDTAMASSARLTEVTLPPLVKARCDV